MVKVQYKSYGTGGVFHKAELTSQLDNSFWMVSGFTHGSYHAISLIQDPGLTTGVHNSGPGGLVRVLLFVPTYYLSFSFLTAL